MNRVFFIIALLFLPGLVRCQITELGPMVGASYYIGELNPYAHYNQNTRPAGGLIFRTLLNSRFALKFNAFYGQVQGFDSQSGNAFRRNRNLHFRSDLLEVGGNIELNFFEYETGEDKNPYTPYLFAGIAYFRMNPKAKYNGEWYELRSLGTEGQGTSARPESKQYSLDQIALPFGLGFKADLNGTICLAVEWGFRKTYTDYLDDVSTTYAPSSVLAEENGGLAAQLADRRKEKTGEGFPVGGQRGNPATKDWYSFSGVSLTFVLGGRSSECKPFQR